MKRMLNRLEEDRMSRIDERRLFPVLLHVCVLCVCWR